MTSEEPQCSLGQLTTIFKIDNYILYVLLDTFYFFHMEFPFCLPTPPNPRGGKPQNYLKVIFKLYRKLAKINLIKSFLAILYHFHGITMK